MRGERRRGGYLWAPVGEPWSRCRDPLSVSRKAARRFDAGQFVEIEIDASPVAPSRKASGSASCQAEYSACSLTSVATAACHCWRPADTAHWPCRVPRWRRAIVGLALAIAGLTLRPGQRALTLRFAAPVLRLTGRRRVYSVT